MPTNTAGGAGYKAPSNQVHYLAKRVRYSDWTGTDNTPRVIGVLPANAVVTYAHTWVVTSFDDTSGDDLDVGITGGDDNLFASAVDVGTDATLTTFDDLADANRWSASAREVTVNFTTAPTGDGTMGEAYVYLEYHPAPVV